MNEQFAPGIRAPLTFVTLRLARSQNMLNAQATPILRSKAGLSLVEWRLLQSLRMFENASLVNNLSNFDRGLAKIEATANIRGVA